MRKLIWALLCAIGLFAGVGRAQQHQNILTWNWTQGSGAAATGYHVWKASTPGGYGTTPLATIPSTATMNYTDPTVSAGQLNYYVITAYNDLGDSPRSNEVTCLTPSSDCFVSNSNWSTYKIFPQQGGVFSLSFTATPNTSGQDTVIGLSQAQATAYTQMAVLVRFSPNNLIEAYDQSTGGYRAVTSISYIPATSYLFALVVNIPSLTYSATVNGIPLAANYLFRSSAIPAGSPPVPVAGTGEAQKYGFVPATKYKPFAPDPNIVAKGADLSNECKTVPGLQALCYDASGTPWYGGQAVLRPVGAPWDIGAYQGTSGGTPFTLNYLNAQGLDSGPNTAQICNVTLASAPSPPSGLTAIMQ